MSEFTAVDLTPVWLTLRLAGVTTLVLLLLGTPLAWWLARTRVRLKPAIEAVVALPLVLPPTVLGFYLLVLLGSRGPLGRFWESLTGHPLAFNFTGLIIGSVIYSLPFAVQPLLHAFEQVDAAVLDAAATLRATPLDRFVSVVLPLSVRGYLTAITLAFTHTMGEFGVVLMIGGDIPGKTQVLSIAIYDHVEMQEYAQAHWLSAGMVAFAFVVLIAIYSLNRRFGVSRL